MLIFIDQPKQIRIVRTSVDEGVSSRAPVGKVMKSNLEISAELRSGLSHDEVIEVEHAIAAYQKAEAVKRQYFALHFPSIVREAMDFFEEDASDTEKQLIMGALMEALRRVRKLERNGRAN